MDLRVRGWETGCQRIIPGFSRREFGGSGTGEPDRRRKGRSPWATRPQRLSGCRVKRRRCVDRTEKREFVAELNQALQATTMVVVARNGGLTVAEASDLRRKMRASGSTYKVAKNRLAHLALEGTQFGGLMPLLKGPTALAWSTDPVSVAKDGRRVRQDQREVPGDGRFLGNPDAECGRDQGARRSAEPGCAACRSAGDDFDPGDPDRGHSAGARGTTRPGLRGLRQKG